MEISTREWATALGARELCREYGWRPVWLMFDRKSLQRWQRHVGENWRELFPEITPAGERTPQGRAVLTAPNFWKMVKGEAPRPEAVITVAGGDLFDKAPASQARR